MMKGAFGIEVIRNGRKLKLNFNNRILKSGLDFQYLFSVNNNTDSIITDLFIGSTHSTITAETTGMPVAPIASTTYTDYETPDFSDETAEYFLNRLVFRFKPQTTMVVRQLGTGRKTTTNIGGIESHKYDYFSLANLVDKEGNLTELTLYQGDVMTITYDVTIYNYINYGGYDFKNNDILWNMVRANPNWQLSGFARKVEVAKLALWDLWGKEFEPFVVKNEIYYPGSNETYYSYSKDLSIRNITMGWKVGAMTKEDLLADAKYKKYISMAGPLPYWTTNFDIWYYTENSVNYMTTASGTMARVMGIERDSFDPYKRFNDVKPVIENVQQDVSWGQYNSKIRISAKITPFAAVYITYKNKLYTAEHNGGDSSTSMFGYANKNGDWYAMIPMSNFLGATEAQDTFGGEFTITAINDAGSARSAPYKMIGQRRGIRPHIYNKQPNSEGVEGFIWVMVYSHYTNYNNETVITYKVVSNDTPTTSVVSGTVYHGSAKYYPGSYFNDYFTISLKNVTTDVFDGNHKIILQSYGISYELPIGNSKLSDRELVTASTIGQATPPPIGSGVVHEFLQVDVKLTKLT